MNHRRLVAFVAAFGALLATGGLWMSRRTGMPADGQVKSPPDGGGPETTASRPTTTLAAPSTTLAAPSTTLAAPRPKRPARPVLPSTTLLAKELGGDAVLAVLQRPDRATASRIRRPLVSLMDPSMDPWWPDTFPRVGQSVPISADALRRLSSIVSNERSWEFEWASGCGPDFGVNFQLERGEHVVNLFLCLECGISLTYFDGVRVSEQNFGPSAKVLGKIARELFPDDPAFR